MKAEIYLTFSVETVGWAKCVCIKVGVFQIKVAPDPSIHVWNSNSSNDCVLIGSNSCRAYGCVQGCELRAQTPPFTWGLFFGVGPAMASLYKNSDGAPFVRAGTPDPSLALITADQFDNRIDCEKDFFIQFPRRPYSQWKRKYSAISYPRSERGLAKKGNPKKREKSPTHLFPFTVFPLASPIHIWLQRLFELKKPFVCLRSYWSLINCKLVRHQVSVPSVGKARLQLLFFFFWKAALLTLPRPRWNVMQYA